MRVKLYLDVDGVLNAWYAHVSWPESEIANEIATVEGRNYKIIWSKDMIEQLFSLELDVHWTTTWQDAANTTLSPMLFGEERSYPVTTPLNGIVDFPSIFWKMEAVEADQKADPTPFVWIDDEISFPHIRWAKDNGGLAISPEPNTGITPYHLELIKSYIQEVSGGTVK